MFRGLFRGFQKSNNFNSRFFVRQPFMPNIRQNITRNYSSSSTDVVKMPYGIAIFGGMFASAIIAHEGFIMPGKKISICQQMNWFNGDENAEIVVKASYPKDIDSEAVLVWGVLSIGTGTLLWASPPLGLATVACCYIWVVQNNKYIDSEIQSIVRKKRIVNLVKEKKDLEDKLEKEKEDFKNQLFILGKEKKDLEDQIFFLERR